MREAHKTAYLAHFVRPNAQKSRYVRFGRAAIVLLQRDDSVKAMIGP